MRLKVCFKEVNDTFNTNFAETNELFLVDFGEVIKVANLKPYTGEYVVIPRVYQQTLATKNKSMGDDVTVEVIPIARVSNIKNGYTVTIG